MPRPQRGRQTVETLARKHSVPAPLAAMSPDPATSLPTTARAAVAQVACCVGCCCGRVDRGFPPVPVERLKEIWKREKLNRTVQLTISGCLGPCDMANVILVMTAAGTEWFGGIDDEGVFTAVIDWARACHAAQALLPVPAVLERHRFRRFAGPARA
jgi:hypothetical protein